MIQVQTCIAYSHVANGIDKYVKTNKNTEISKGYGISHGIWYLFKQEQAESVTKTGIIPMHILELCFPVKIFLLIKIGQFRERERWF